MDVDPEDDLQRQLQQKAVSFGQCPSSAPGSVSDCTPHDIMMDATQADDDDDAGGEKGPKSHKMDSDHVDDHPQAAIKGCQIGSERPMGFQALPIQLYNEIFKFLDLADRNKVRRVSSAWDRAVKYGFGVRVIIDNNNLKDITTVDDVLEAQVRNLTLRIPPTTSFKYDLGIRILDICGMIYSKNLVRILTSFSNLIQLKLSRVYLETDNRIDLTPEERAKLPLQLETVSMTFLKTIHKTPGSFDLGRNTDIFGLTSSDYLVLNFLNVFNLPNLTELELCHDIDQDVRNIRNSEMIERHRTGNAEIINSGTETTSKILAKILGVCSPALSLTATAESGTLSSGPKNNTNGNKVVTRPLKRLRLDNVPLLNCAALTSQSSSSITLNIPQVHGHGHGHLQGQGQPETWSQTQLQHLTVDGILPGDWSSLLREQTQLVTLDLVILHPSILEAVKLAVNNSMRTLVTLHLTITTPNDMAIHPNFLQGQQGQGQGPGQLQMGPAPGPGHGHLHDDHDADEGGQVNQNVDMPQAQPPPPPPPPPPLLFPQFPHQHIDDTFDLIFLSQCGRLTHLSIKYAPKILDVSFLPLSLKSLELCGHVPLDGVLHFLSRGPNTLTSIDLQICSGPVVRDLPPEHPVIYDASAVKRLIRESNLTRVVICEAGAGDHFEALIQELEDDLDMGMPPLIDHKTGSDDLLPNSGGDSNEGKEWAEMEEDEEREEPEEEEIEIEIGEEVEVEVEVEEEAQGSSNGIKVSLDFTNFKVTLGEGGFGRRQIASVPRLTLIIPENFDRRSV